MTYQIVQVSWSDPCEYRNITAESYMDDPLVNLVSFGILLGTFKDKHEMSYLKLSHKLCIDGSINNDDIIVIPLGCIHKVRQIGIFMGEDNEETINEIDFKTFNKGGNKDE